MEGFTPAVGDTFEVLTYATRTGNFEHIHLPDLGPDREFVLHYTATALLLVTEAVPPPDPDNQPSAAADDAAATDEDTSVLIDVLADDTDPDGDTLSLRVAEPPERGTAVVEEHQIHYTPNPGFSGTDRFTYQARDGRGGIGMAEVVVTVEARVPGIPVLSAPQDGAEDVPLGVTLTWRTAAGAASYDLQLSTAADFATTVVDTAGLATSSFDAEGLIGSTLYFWRVRAVNEAGPSAFSAPFRFTTATGVAVEEDGLPGQFSLAQNYPNPFNPNALISGHDGGLSKAANAAGTDITPPGLTGGAYPSSIGLNPNNADELIATFSNYNIDGVWYSADGGGSWTNVDGNLGGEDGPSVRWASIVPTGEGTMYFLATSTGVYSAASLSGANTTWVQEGGDVIGNVVVNMITARPEDGLVVAGTHGRGVYSAQLAPGGGGSTAIASVDVQQLEIEVRPGESASASFQLQNTGGGPLNYTVTTSASDQPGAAGKGTLSNFMVARPGARAPGRSSRHTAQGAELSQAAFQAHPAPPPAPAVQGDVLLLDEGDDAPDVMLGLGAGTPLYWVNQFDLSGSGFQLESVQFYMRTESASSNPVWLAVYDGQEQTLTSGTVQLELAPTGAWYNVTLDQPLNFTDGQTFFLEIGASASIGFPAGADTNASVTGKSYYFDADTEEYVNLSTSVDMEDAAEVPDRIRLAQNYPNPFNPETTIRYELPAPGRVLLDVFDLSGRQVAVLEAGEKRPGLHEVRWNGRDVAGRPVASGLYVYRLRVTSEGGQEVASITKKMIMLK